MKGKQVGHPGIRGEARSLFVIGLLWAVALASGCSAGRGAFSKYARLRLGGYYGWTGDRYAFRLEFATIGSRPLLPPFRLEDLEFYVDGEKASLPRSRPSDYFLGKWILPRGPKAHWWWRDEYGMCALLGSGEHELQFRFGNVWSNVLLVSVPKEGRILFRPRVVMRSWPSRRGPGLAEWVEEGWTPLHEAAWDGKGKLVKSILAEGADLNAVNNHGETALHFAATRGFREVVRILLQAGANPNASAHDGWTPLHEAAAIGDEQMAASLIAAGAEVNTRDGFSQTPLRVGARWGGERVPEVLLTNGAKQDIFTAVALGDYSLCTRLLQDEPALVDEVDLRDGSTVLHWAADKGQARVAELLLEAGAEVDARDNNGWTPLHHAAHKGHRHVVRFLLQHGAQVDAQDKVRGGVLLTVRPPGTAEVTIRLFLAEPAEE